MREDRRFDLSLKKKHIPLLISILIGIFSIIYYLLYYKYFKIDVDEGLLINGAMRVLSGELPLKDFHQYTLGRYYLLAAWFLFFWKKYCSGKIVVCCPAYHKEHSCLSRFEKNYALAL